MLQSTTPTSGSASRMSPLKGLAATLKSLPIASCQHPTPRLQHYSSFCSSLKTRFSYIFLKPVLSRCVETRRRTVRWRLQAYTSGGMYLTKASPTRKSNNLARILEITLKEYPSADFVILFCIMIVLSLLHVFPCSFLQLFQNNSNWQAFLPYFVHQSQSGYFSHLDTFSIFDQLINHFDQVNITKSNVGKTVQGRDIPAYRFSKGEKKNCILVTGLIHARQFISNNLVLLLTMRVLYEDKYDYSLLEDFDLLVIPVINLDGAVYIEKSGDIYVRKNRRKTECRQNLQGVDLNRNFDWKFGSVNSSWSVCQEQYHGDRPFSQPQTQAIKNLVESQKVMLHIDIHSYGNQFIIPYSVGKPYQFLKKQPVHMQFYQTFKRISPVKASQAIQSLGYQADGVMMDWMLSKDVFSVTYEGGSYFSQPKYSLLKDIQISQKAFSHFLNYGKNKPRDNYTVTQTGSQWIVSIKKWTTLAKSRVQLLLFKGNMSYAVYNHSRIEFKVYGNETIEWGFGETLQIKLSGESDKPLLIKGDNWQIPIYLQRSKSGQYLFFVAISLIAVAMITFSVFVVVKQKRRIRKQNSQFQFY